MIWGNAGKQIILELPCNGIDTSAAGPAFIGQQDGQ